MELKLQVQKENYIKKMYFLRLLLEII
jgi:hypothetical protein